jgi:D-serine deaminase-like pyridoxal phosphate-dependent protein
MTGRRPAEPGMTITQVETPALIVDLDAMEANIKALAARVAAYPSVRVTPHAKAHKSVEIAKRQIAAGASRMCCQNVAEAEAMVAGGIKSILLSNEIIGTEKAKRLAQVARTAKVGVCVDHVDQVTVLAEAARNAGVTFDVLIEIDVGMGRCGVTSSAEAVALAREVAKHTGLRFAGLQAYHGTAQHLRHPEERVAAISKATAFARETADALREAGLPCDVIAGAGTGSYENEMIGGVYNELQCGSYVFMDADYGRNDTAYPFRNALFILTSVISAAAPGRAVCDAGLKSLTAESGLPLAYEAPGITYIKATDEHGTLQLSPQTTVKPGDKLKLIPGHCDPTVNLHDWLVACRGDKVEAVWPVARGW